MARPASRTRTSSPPGVRTPRAPARRRRPPWATPRAPTAPTAWTATAPTGTAPTAPTATAAAPTPTAPTAPMATASTSSIPAIERCAGDPAAFVRDHWAKAPLLRRGAGPDAHRDRTGAGRTASTSAREASVGPDGFDDLLSLDDVDRILATTSPRTPS